MAAATVKLRPLDATSASELKEATALLAESLTWDRVAVVAEEKLFASNGKRRGYTIGAFSPSGDELLGVLAQAGRFIKMLAVRPGARRRGIGTALIEAARENLALENPGGPRPRLRAADHAGNYLSPGLDERYTDGQEFLRARGFAQVATSQNLRAPLQDNPSLRPEHLAALDAKVAAFGYTVRRATTADQKPLSDMVAKVFSPIWALELERALGPALGGPAAERTPELPEGAAVHVALDPGGAPVAFAAHDGNNRGLGWFGPMGTLDAHRGKGLGELLHLLCLRDVAQSGQVEGGVIAWVGPIEFYARVCGAKLDRRFVAYEES